MLSSISGINKNQAGFKAIIRFFPNPAIDLPKGNLGHDEVDCLPKQELSQYMDRIQDLIKNGEITCVNGNIPNKEYAKMKRFQCGEDIIFLSQKLNHPNRSLLPVAIAIEHDGGKMGETIIGKESADSQDQKFDETVKKLDELTVKA
jgi:hypothetical protein